MQCTVHLHCFRKAKSVNIFVLKLITELNPGLLHVHVQLLLYSFDFIFSLNNLFTEGALTITEKPDNPTYVQKEDTAVLKWNYTADDKTTELQEILWRVLHVDGVTYPLIIEDNKGKVKLSRNIPQAYASRVEKKARATLLVRNVTFNDSTQFTFVLQGVLGVDSSKQSAIDLIVTGNITHHLKLSLLINCQFYLMVTAVAWHPASRASFCLFLY